MAQDVIGYGQRAGRLNRERHVNGLTVFLVCFSAVGAFRGSSAQEPILDFIGDN
jgi:hypothetical protein